MDRGRVRELHFICPFENVASVLQFGILCKKAQRKQLPNAKSVANASVQDLRAAVRIPPHSTPLHSYANLYFHAGNSMMSALRHLNSELAIIRVDHSVIDLPGVIVSDRNAAAGAAIFRPAAQGVAALDADYVYARWWNQTLDQRQRRCAEVLVPEKVRPDYIQGAYVMNEACRQALAPLVRASFTITVDPDFYF
jgi:hypothetical protein